jgi:hypothetical protein
MGRVGGFYFIIFISPGKTIDENLKKKKKKKGGVI